MLLNFVSAQVKGLKEQIKEMQVQEHECEKKWEQKWEKKEDELAKNKETLAKARAELKELKGRFFVRVIRKIRKG